jgi:acyl-CoA thioesterase-2
MGLARTYGGHIVGQAVAAAQATVANDRQLHSLHAYFLRGGRHGEPFHYDVEVVRDGRSYTARRVRAWQDEGRSSFELLASFAVAEDGPTAALQTPPEALQVPPETLPTYRELVDQMAGSEQMPSPDGWTTRVSPIDIRPTNASWHPDGTGPNNSVNQWIRADGILPDDPALHIAVLAYQSDESLADTVFAPFGLNWGDADNAVASLDHALWIHRPIDCNRWIYVEQFPEAVHGGRGLGRARMWNQDGQLVASATQDVLLRIG